MTFAARLAEIRERIHAAKFAVVIGLHDGAHFIEKPDPVEALTGFKALGPVAALLDRDGAVTRVVTPSWDVARAIEMCCLGDLDRDGHGHLRIWPPERVS